MKNATRKESTEVVKKFIATSLMNNMEIIAISVNRVMLNGIIYH